MNESIILYDNKKNQVGEIPRNSIKIITDEDGENKIQFENKIFGVYKIFNKKIKLFMSVDSDGIKIVNINYK